MPEEKSSSLWNIIIKPKDDFTIKFIYTKPNNGQKTWFVYYPKHLLEDLDPDEFWERILIQVTPILR
jgi:hypothetical protein